MTSRIPPAQRRLVLLVGAAAVAAGLFAGVAVILASGQPAVRPEQYEPFVAGNAATLGQMIATEQPLFYADPTGGTRGFALAIEDGTFVALHVVPPNGSPDCPIDWDLEAEEFRDCNDRVFETSRLRRFETEVENNLVVVDLRTVEPPPETAPKR